MRSVIYITLGTLIIAGCTRPAHHDSENIAEKTYMHRYGVEVTPDDWDTRGGNGQIITKQRDGIVITNNYSQGKLHGATTYSYPHSDLTSRTEMYEEGELLKEIKHYHSGLPQEEIAYVSDTDKTITMWHESGAPWMKERYNEERLVEGEYYASNNCLESRIDNGNGERIRRDDFGNIISRDEIQNGLMISRTIYHPNGNPKEITPYTNNIISGLRRTFLPDGEPSTAEEWQNGVQHGITTLFQNGEKIAEIPYVSGTKEGIERRYSGGTQVVEEITWVAGTKHGPYNTYVGNKVQTDWYHQGKRVNKAMYDILSRPTSIPG